MMVLKRVVAMSACKSFYSSGLGIMLLSFLMTGQVFFASAGTTSQEDSLQQPNTDPGVAPLLQELKPPTTPTAQPGGATPVTQTAPIASASPTQTAQPVYRFDIAPPKKTVTGQDAGQINTDGTLSLNYLCNPDPNVKTGDLSRALMAEIDALHGNDAPNAPDLQSLQTMLGQLQTRVSTLTKSYTKTPTLPRGSATLNDCYTDAEIEVFKSNFATVANAWINHKKLAGNKAPNAGLSAK